ncbi:hypothetical protein TNCV_1446531 [Trichonephila clavipes]|nr:hypothetical protein TNCV_1446531 [Trichonephila clavipes]
MHLLKSSPGTDTISRFRRASGELDNSVSRERLKGEWQNRENIADRNGLNRTSSSKGKRRFGAHNKSLA